MPGLARSVEMAWARPTEVKAPISALKHLSQVKTWAEPRVTGCPQFEPELAPVLCPNSLQKGKPTFSQEKDRVVGKMAETNFGVAMQGVATQSSISLLAMYVDRLAKGPPSPEATREMLMAAGAMARLAQAGAACFGASSSQSITQLRYLWLSNSTLKGDVLRSRLVAGPVSREGLFGPAVRDLLVAENKREETRSTMVRLLHPPRPPPAVQKAAGEVAKRKRKRKPKEAIPQPQAAAQPQQTGAAVQHYRPRANPGRGRGRGRGAPQQPRGGFTTQ